MKVRKDVVSLFKCLMWKIWRPHKESHILNLNNVHKELHDQPSEAAEQEVCLILKLFKTCAEVEFYHQQQDV